MCWDIALGKQQPQQLHNAIHSMPSGYFLSCVLSPDGSLLALVRGSTQGSVGLFDLAQCTCLASLTDFDYWAYSMRFSPTRIDLLWQYERQ